MTDLFLTQLLALDIPTVIHPEPGFLEIAGIPHYENVNSRIYAYFLEQSHFPTLAQVFIDSLLELVEKKQGKIIGISNYDVITENLTKKNYRIDITLDDSAAKSAVIIENKIYHHLDNDLVDYWEHFNYPDENKVGVLLTLEPFEIPKEVHGKFVNITHQEWVAKIQENRLPGKLPNKIYTYLNDFFQTIDNLTKSNTMNEQAKFYFQHTKQVIKANETFVEGRAFIEGQITQLADKLNWKVYGNKHNWKNIWDKENELETFYTLWYDPLLNGEGKITVIIELIREDVKKEERLDAVLKDRLLDKKMHKGERLGNYLQYACKEYDLTIDKIENFADTVYEIIQEDFAEIMKIALKNNYPDKNIN